MMDAAASAAESYEVQATAILGDARRPMLKLWAPRAIRSARALTAGEIGSPMCVAVGVPDRFRDMEVFFWTPR